MLNKHKSIRLIVRSVLCFLLIVTYQALTGCGSPAQTMKVDKPNSISSKLLLRGDLSNTTVSDLRASKINGFLKVQATLTNITKDDDVIFYRFHWYNEAGMEAGSEEAWKSLPLTGLASESITSLSTNKLTIDFKLELQSPNNTGGFAQ
jgi:uncharacterized protein YcfL